MPPRGRGRPLRIRPRRRIGQIVLDRRQGGLRRLDVALQARLALGVIGWAAEAALAAVEDELADPAAWSAPERAAAAARRHEEARAAVEALYAELEALSSGGR